MSDLRTALAAADLCGARAIVAAAGADGVPAGRLYVEVLRPALAEHYERRDPAALPTLGIGDAILAELSAGLPVGIRSGAGRAAVLSCRDRGIEAVDGRVANDFLEADGWSVERVAGDHRRPEVAGLARGGSLELAVAVTAGPEDALRLAPVCTALRRLADPPVILLCDFSGRPAPRQRAASSSLGADAVALDPGQLVRHAAERLPTEGRRRWGVRLSRSGGTLVLTPTGRLDATSIGRLFEVALTRLGTFSRLVLDLRDVAAIEPAGLEELARRSERDQLEGAELSVVAHADLRERLEASGLAQHRRVLASDVE